MYPYILIYNADFGSQSDITDYLKEKGMQCTTVNGFSYCIFILSDENDVDKLSNLLRERFQFGRHAVFSAEKRQGWMPTSLWNFYKGQIN